jgi:hypothetical protein
LVTRDTRTTGGAPGGVAEGETSMSILNSSGGIVARQMELLFLFGDEASNDPKLVCWLEMEGVIVALQKKFTLKLA